MSKFLADKFISREAFGQAGVHLSKEGDGVGCMHHTPKLTNDFDGWILISSGLPTVTKNEKIIQLYSELLFCYVQLFSKHKDKKVKTLKIKTGV